MRHISARVSVAACTACIQTWSHLTWWSSKHGSVSDQCIRWSAIFSFYLDSRGDRLCSRLAEQSMSEHGTSLGTVAVLQCVATKLRLAPTLRCPTFPLYDNTLFRSNLPTHQLSYALTLQLPLSLFLLVLGVRLFLFAHLRSRYHL